ncbi:uncharacterized protein K02A2.6-like [Colletes gigas]|uniref:uncharacterized protein K02A2.6-like n=1 Tax=Colletes gigas TaxID=935657 RepID=UPI001C9AF7D0|nr:uncharacterized protein K02A2.6-like [Colletes gigas]
MAETVVHSNFAIETFDSTTTNWKRWLKRFEGAVTVFKIPDAQKVAYLLHFIGSKSFDIICDKLAPLEPYTQTYATITSHLEEFYAPTPLEIAENYRFHQRKQTEGESIHQFVAALHKLSINCNFGSYLKTALRNQFVFGLVSRRTQARLLETKELSFDKAVEIALSMELTEKDVNQIQAAGSATVEYMGHREPPSTKKGRQTQHKNPSSFAKTKRSPQNTYNNNSNSSTHYRVNNNVSCFRYGGKHLASKCSLNREIVCSNCGVKGHLAKVCMKKNRASANRLSDVLLVNTEHIRHRERYFARVLVEGTEVRFEIDSGAAVTIVGKNFVKQQFPDAQIEKSELQLFTFCKTTVPVIGYVKVRVQYKGMSKLLHMYVTSMNREPLMGREWIRQLTVQLNDTVWVLSANREPELQSILQRYQSKLDPSCSKIKKIQARLTLKETAKSIFLKARKVPFKIMPLVEQEIKRLVGEGILQETNTSSWATPIVPVLKKDNSVRLCGDFSVTVNQQLVVDEYPLPTIDELFSTLAGGQKFSKIDLKQAYLQMEVHPEDREILTLNTHRGLFKCTRLLYGIASAPAIWQREIEKVLQGIPGISVFLDDIKITGPDDQTHLERLNAVLTRLAEYNIRMNMEKSEFLVDGIHYCGHYIDRNGIHKERKKMEAIEQMPRPRNISELRAFLGLVNYYGRFIRNLSTILTPLHTLLEKVGGKPVPFKWTRSCEAAFAAAKRAFTSNEVLAHYDPKLPLIVACDASKYGVGAVLSQKYPDGSERAIQYASQSLSRTQRNYAQIDKEAYAIIYALKKFYQFLYGNRFTLYTDHKPLTQIFSPSKALPIQSAMRMQHYKIFLQAFNYDIKYKNTIHSNADALSRLPVHSEDNNDFDIVDDYEIKLIDSLPITFKELATGTAKDAKLQQLVQALQSGRHLKPNERFNVPLTEFSCQQGILMRDSKVLIPRKLRNKILDELHEGHLGIVKMKSLARRYCWWPGIDSDLERLAKDCGNCNLVRNNPPKIQVQTWPQTERVFQRVHIDYAGPFKGHYFFVLVDAFSKWPELFITNDITSSTTIEKCRQVFATFGIPEMIVSDNGRHFTSHEFKEFLKFNGIVHKTTAPFHPATNGLAERWVQTFKLMLNKKLQGTLVTKKELQVAVHQILLRYRNTPHQSTGESPAERMFNRRLRTRLDLLLPRENTVHEKGLDKKRGIVRELQLGDRVECRNYYGKEKWALGRVKQRLGYVHYVIRLDNGKEWKRHINQIQKVGNVPIQGNKASDILDYGQPNDIIVNVPAVAADETDSRINGEQREASAESNVGITPRRSSRNRKLPTRCGMPIPWE